MATSSGRARSATSALGVLAVLVAAPLLAAISLAVRLLDGPPVLFRQRRIGKDLQAFDLFKFRTMRPSTSAENDLTTDLQRVTALGRFLRSTHLDELPQLLNICRGEMGFIGPRPMLPEVADVVASRFPERFAVVPGLTGLAQVEGGRNMPLSERYALDVRYVRERSPRMRASILVRTVTRLLDASDSTQDLSDIDDIGLAARLAAGPK